MVSLLNLELQYETELEYINSLGLDATYTSNIVVEIDNAYRAIRAYLGASSNEDLSQYGYIACELALVYKHLQRRNLDKLQGNTTVTQRTLGSMSETVGSSDISLDSYGLTDAIKAKLPARKYAAF